MVRGLVQNLRIDGGRQRPRTAVVIHPSDLEAVLAVRNEYIKDDPERERRIVVVSADLSEAEFSAMASKSTAAAEEIWMLIGDHKSATAPQLARLLAVLELDRHHKLLHPGFLPARAAGVFLFTDGMIRHGRGRSLPPWALREVDRLADQLAAEHSDYMAKLLEAVRGKPPEVLPPVPKDFILRDEAKLLGLAPPLPTVTPDLSGAGPRGHSDHDAQEDYARDRYMGHVTDAELRQRIADVFTNLYVIDDQNRVSARNGEPAFPLWRRLFAELIKEVELRFGRYPAGWKKGDGLLDGVEWPGSLTFHKTQPEPIVGSLKPRSQPPGLVLVKYGEKRHLDPFVSEGKLRISPASVYEDASLDPARRDDELRFAIDVGSYGIGRLGGLPHSEVSRSGIRKKVMFESDRNYYVSCFSRVLARRLLYDFHADCCVLITEPEEFQRRLASAVAGLLKGWHSVAADVVYYDPLQVTQVEVRPFEWKHFRFAYQEEFRIGWFPPHRRQTLAPLEVELGGLGDIAEIVGLSAQRTVRPGADLGEG